MQFAGAFVVLLVVLNCIVLLGQLWPEGAPPFARAVNILFLVLSLIYFVRALLIAAIRRRSPASFVT
ncbi:MAG: hypothetical protein H0X73_06225 [Chthoniobacterales bacterium]|nr:hypothetical protein [Chthoniobacterales bacterium]